MNLSEKKCIPCEGGVPPLSLDQRISLLKKLHTEWTLTNNNSHLFRKLKFQDFITPMKIAWEIGQLAEEQWHHPDIKIAWGILEIEIWTHKINSLVESDFIFAAKVDQIINNFKKEI